MEWRPPSLTQIDAETNRPAAVYPETLSRPIFSKTRRQAVVQAATAPVVAAPAPNLKLLAIFSSESARRVFIVSASSPKGRWTELGDSVDGWTITEMQPAFIVLRNAGSSINFKLYRDPGEAKRSSTGASSSFPLVGPPPRL